MAPSRTHALALQALLVGLSLGGSAGSAGDAAAGACLQDGDSEPAALLQRASGKALQTEAEAVGAQGDGGRAKRPHIILTIADDIGYTGMGFMARRHADAEKPDKPPYEAWDKQHTPNLDKLVEDGILLSRHYCYSSCTPSRMALMTGRLPVRLGVLLGEPLIWDGGSDPKWGYEGAPLGPAFLPAKLREAGYATHMVGKADGFGLATLGHVPASRGFDSSIVTYHHGTDYYSYRATFYANGEEPPCPGDTESRLKGQVYDFWEGYRAQPRNVTQASLKAGTNKEDIFLDRALEIIRNHDARRQPLFLYYATAFAHTPLQAPRKDINRVARKMCRYNRGCLAKHSPRCTLLPGSQHLESRGSCALQERVTYLAMVHYFDDAMGKVRQALTQKGMWDDTLLVYMADNGGAIGLSAGGNNWPLKGGKGSDWEGGFRTTSFVSGGFVPRGARGSVFSHPMHVTDWHATLVRRAGGVLADPAGEAVGLPPVESRDYWPALTGACRKMPRREIHLSPWAVTKYVRGRWVKIVVQVQAYSNHTGPDYPNNTCPPLGQGLGGCRPLNPAPFGPAPWPQDCGEEGCVFDLDADEKEEHPLDCGKDRRLCDELRDRLDYLNRPSRREPGYFEPFRGCKVHDLGCRVARSQWEGHYGSFLDVPGCQACANTKDGSGPPGEVERTTNVCQCAHTEAKCTIAGAMCKWCPFTQKCGLRPLLRGMTYAEMVLKFEKAGYEQRNCDIGACD